MRALVLGVALLVGLVALLGGSSPLCCVILVGMVTGIHFYQAQATEPPSVRSVERVPPSSEVSPTVEQMIERLERNLSKQIEQNHNQLCAQLHELRSELTRRDEQIGEQFSMCQRSLEPDHEMESVAEVIQPTCTIQEEMEVQEQSPMEETNKVLTEEVACHDQEEVQQQDHDLLDLSPMVSTKESELEFTISEEDVSESEDRDSESSEEAFERHFPRKSRTTEIRRRRKRTRSSTQDSTNRSESFTSTFKPGNFQTMRSNSLKYANGAIGLPSGRPSPVRARFLQASHRQSSRLHELALDQDTRSKCIEAEARAEEETKSAAEMEEQPPKAKHARSSLIVRRRLNEIRKIGLNSSCAIVTRSDKLLYKFVVHLPEGGSADVQCFQDASESEIIQSLFRKLQGRLSSDEVVNSAEDFVVVTKLFLNPDFRVTGALYRSVSSLEKETVIHLFIELAVTQRLTLELLTEAISTEVSNHKESITTLFRANTWQTMFVAGFLRFYLRPIFLDCLQNTLRDALVDESLTQKLDSPEEVERGRVELACKIFDAIHGSFVCFPNDVKGIWCLLAEKVEERFPGKSNIVMAGFLFLRLTCPLLLSQDILPEDFPDDQRDTAWKHLKSATRYLQLIANQNKLTSDLPCGDIQLLEDYQCKVTVLFQSLIEQDQRPEENLRPPSLASGLTTREAVNRLFALLRQNIREVIRCLHKYSTANDSHIEQLVDIIGYPLLSKDRYQLRVTGTEYYVPSGDYRPLVDNEDLQAHFLQLNFVRKPSFILEERDKGTRKHDVVRILSLLDAHDLPSSRFESLDVHRFREQVIVPFKEIELPPILHRAIIQEQVNALLPSSFLVRVHVSHPISVTKSIFTFPEQTVQEFLEQVMKKAKSISSTLDGTSRFILRLAGTQQFFADNVELGRFLCISDLIMRRHPVEFALENRKDLPGLEWLFSPPSLEDRLAGPLPFDDILENSYFRYANLNNAEPDRYPTDIEFRSLFEMEESKEHFDLLIEGIFTRVPMKVPPPMLSSSLGGSNAYVFLQVKLCYNGKSLCPPTRTSPCTIEDLEWKETIPLEISPFNIPREARLCFTLFAIHPKNDAKRPLAWASYRLYDCNDCLAHSTVVLGMYEAEEQAPLIGICGNNEDDKAPQLRFSLPQYTGTKLTQLPRLRARETPLQVPDDLSSLTDTEKAQLQRLLSKDALYKPSEDELRFLWHSRELYHEDFRGLSKFLLSVTWTNPFVVEEAYRLLEIWAPPPHPRDALQLLGVQYEDYRIRQQAVRWLSDIEDEELLDCLLQLVHVLRAEKDHLSPLSVFLLNRSIAAPATVGHRLFWLLSGEMSDSIIEGRFKLLMEALLWAYGDQRDIFLRERATLNKMRHLSTVLSEEKSFTAKSEKLIKLLEETQFASEFRCPYDSSYRVGAVQVEKCRAMDSALAPIRFAFHNADPLSSTLIMMLFKAGDDLRQDILTLQMIRIMDKLWRNAGLDLQMSAYDCLPTGTNEGLIAIVPNSVTLADIHKKAAGVRGAFVERSVANWLKSQNRSDHDYDSAREIFIRSCAGYCVATYILGIGDRHNDNIMISQTGHLFHIDFGRFLGKWQTWRGLKRDRAPFVFTPEFAYVMGGKNSEDFERFCEFGCQAFQILRENAHIFLNLFTLMLSAGMPELKTNESLLYLSEAFALQKTEEEAHSFFQSLILKSLNTTATRLNNALHILVHPA